MTARQSDLPRSQGKSRDTGRVRAILGPTNTGKTHLAIERMCGHSSGAIGFPLRLLAREVYDKVRSLKGDAQVALITGEERIEPPNARYLLCTAEAMPRDGGGRAFVALDEAQLAANRERGHIFTDRLLNARGREETMLLGAATLEPMVRALVPGVEVESRPRFSTLTYAGTAKLSRLPPRSAVVAFSIEQVYQTAELLRRFRGGAAVVMGALSPQTRNRQVELFQSGEVDYIVATDAIGMGLNLNVGHVAFASLSKFDGVRQRRLDPAEMAQIAGRAGRHHKDGTFGTLGGGGASEGRGRGEALALTDEEVYAIEQHRFAPLTRLYWREAEPRFDTLATLIDDLEAKPFEPELAAAPEAIDLAVLKRLGEDPEFSAGLTTPHRVKRFWEACQLPDFRQQGAEAHSRFVARLWRDLMDGHLGADFVAARIAELDRPQGDIDTLQGRLMAVRSWAYICQRPDWVLARDEMAARARDTEARLSDALHQRLTERFVNRRTAVLMKAMGKDAGLLSVALEEDGRVLVEGQSIGHLEGFRFVMDAHVDSEERRLLLAAAQKHLPQLLAQRAQALVTSELGELRLESGAVMLGDVVVATLEQGRFPSKPRLVLSRDLALLERNQHSHMGEGLEHWLDGQLAPLAPLRAIEAASEDLNAGSEVRALLLTLIEHTGTIAREAAGLAVIPKEKRPLLRSMGISIGALYVFVPALLKPAARALLHAIGADPRPVNPGMQAVIDGAARLPAGYRRAGTQAIRINMVEKLIRTAHDNRAKARDAAGGRQFTVDGALATSMGLAPDNFVALMRDAGFRALEQPVMAEGMFGPPRPRPWSWRSLRNDHHPSQATQRHPNTKRRTRKAAGNARGEKRSDEHAGKALDEAKPARSQNGGHGGGPNRPPHRPREAPRPSSPFAGLADLLGPN